MPEVFPLILFRILMNLEGWWDRKVGKKDIFLQVQQFNLIHDLTGIVDGFRNITEQFRHLRFGLKVKLVIRKLKAAVSQVDVIIHKIIITRCALFFAGIDAKQDVMGVVVFTIGIMTVVCGNNGYIIFF